MAVATPTYERAAGRRKLAKSRKALPDGSFPIPNVSYLDKAIKAVGRAAPGKRPVLAALIRKRARQLGPAGAARLRGSWADPKKNTKQMAQTLYGQLIELKYTPADARTSVAETVKAFSVVELATVAGSYDGPQVTKMSGSKSKKIASSNSGKLNPVQRRVMKRLIAQGKPSAVAYKIACNVGGMKKAD